MYQLISLLLIVQVYNTDKFTSSLKCNVYSEKLLISTALNL